MGCWGCQIEPHLATLLVWHHGRKTQSHKGFDDDIDLFCSQSSPPLLPRGAGRESKLITHLVIDGTVDRAFP